MITGVVLARNEERNIVQCLECLRPHVEEIILIDMESTDHTLELASPLVDRMLHHPLVPNFDSARNIAIHEAKNDWMWFVDADERLSTCTGKLIRDLIRNQGDEFEAITIPFKSYFCQQWMQNCGWWPGYTMPRVLKKGHFRFVERLHGGVEVSGRTNRLSPDPRIAIDHFSYESVEHYIEKLNRYTSTEAIQLAESGRGFDWRESFRHMMFDLWQYYEFNEGYLDGLRGWILSWLSGQYRWLSHAKLIDRTSDSNNGHPSEEVPANLDEVVQLMEESLTECRATNPQTPLGLVWRGPLWDPSGYADESRAFIKGLSQGERPLAVRDIHWATQECELNGQDAALLHALCRVRRPRFTAALTNCIPTLVKPDPAASLNILRTTFETDRLPTEWLGHILTFDEVWVISQYNYQSFVRSWVPPEKLRIVPSCIDVDLFNPEGDSIELPAASQNRFVFLSVFDWGWRKGWDILVKAYSQAFRPEEGKALLLKITRNHGHSLEYIRQQVDRVLKAVGQSLVGRQDIILWDDNLGCAQLSALYRSVDAFVLPSRGEGWGRPYMEAMATGLPTIATRASGNIDFMDDENSFLISAQLRSVSNEAFQEIPTYEGHSWYEPDTVELRNTMRHIVQNTENARIVGTRAASDVRSQYGVHQGRKAIDLALSNAEKRFNKHRPGIPGISQIQVELEGELFAGHSFSKVNEQLVTQAADDDHIALSVRRVSFNSVSAPVTAEENRILSFVDRPLACDPQVTIRHCFPPNWEKPRKGRWVHIQPWEFGHLPLDWLKPLRDHVDEIWVPSNYVRRVYEQSGISSSKIQVIPWGIDASLYRPDAIPLLLPTSKKFKFLFVGGAIARKGFDRVLEAYLQEFRPDEDVALVIKDQGGKSFYRYGNLLTELEAAVADNAAPEIIHIDRQLTEGQMPHLYTACDCLVAPYRGEGFGLPVLEAMACGLPPIVPRGGATDDFVNKNNGFLLESVEKETHHVWELAGPCLELEVDTNQLRSEMRRVFQSDAVLRSAGVRAAEFVRGNFTWQTCWQRMKDRLHKVVTDPCSLETTRAYCEECEPQIDISAIVVLDHSLQDSAARLARVAPFVKELQVISRKADETVNKVAKEYGASVELAQSKAELSKCWKNICSKLQSQWIWIPSRDGFLCREPDAMAKIPTILSTQSSSVQGVTIKNGSDEASAASELFLRNQGDTRVISNAEQILSRACVLPTNFNDTISIDLSSIRNNGPDMTNRNSVQTPRQTNQLPIEPWLEAWVPHSGRVFLDVGANIGVWTRWLASAFDQVHAIEPNPKALVVLRRSLPSNVKVHEVGAWKHETTIEFTEFEQSVHFSAYFREEGIHTGQARSSRMVKCLPIDTMNITGPVDFIKCDTEGAEVETLIGAGTTIQRDKPWLLIEIHSTSNFEKVTELLKEWNYLYTVIRDPLKEPFSTLWYQHCWLSCQPMH